MGSGVGGGGGRIEGDRTGLAAVEGAALRGAGGGGMEERAAGVGAAAAGGGGGGGGGEGTSCSQSHVVRLSGSLASRHALRRKQEPADV